YDVFGSPQELVSDRSSAFLYNGEQYDPETGLIFLRNRYYDPKIGRFITRDPSLGAMRDPQTKNPYPYASNNPVNFVDPLGLMTSRSSLDSEEIRIPIGRAWNRDWRIQINIEGPITDFISSLKFWELDWWLSHFPVRPGINPEPGHLYGVGISFPYMGTAKFGVGWTPANTADLGGVSLNKTAQLMLEIDDITGATYDPATGQVILFGQEDVALPEMDLDDLAVAVYSVYGGQDPGVSIDPPLVDGQFSVRYVGQTRQTEFGWVMFEADRVMKILALGKDNITGQPVTSNVPGYKSMLQRELESGTCEPGETGQRFWFQPKEVQLVRSGDGNSMVFDEVSMEVLTESKFEDNVVGDPEAEDFAAHFTQHYGEFAEEWPVLKDLKRLGKIVAIIKWIKDNNIPIDLSFIENYDIEYFSTPDNTPSTTVEGDNGTCHITMQGGVTYRPPNEYLADDPVDPVTDAMRDAALGQRPAETEFLWDFQPPAQAFARGLMSAQDQSLTAVAQSFTRSRKDGNVGFNEVDLSYPISGTFTLNLTRYYDSFGDRPGGFGYGWQELPFQLRFPVVKQRFTFGPENIALDLYERIWLVERQVGREDAYILLGIDADDLPLYHRPGAMDLLREQTDGSFLLTKVDGARTTFNSDGSVTTVTDLNDNSVQYVYGGDGRLVRIQGPGDRAIELSYNGQGRISQASGPGGRLVTYSYDADGNLHTATKGSTGATLLKQAAGQTQTYTYDADHRIVSAADAEHRPIFSASYDDYNRATANRAGTAADFAYDFNLAQRQTQITDPYGEETLKRFDEEYRLTEQSNALDNKLEIVYDGDFGPKVITDAHGVVTQLAYDQRGNLTTILDGAGGQVDLFYDWRDNIIASRDPEGVETAFGYDDKGNLTAVYHDVLLVQDEDGNLVSFYYDPNNVTMFSYGATGSLDAVSDPLGHQSQFAYGADGQPVIATTPSSLETTFDYDPRSRLTALQTGGSQVDFSYDDDDNLTGITTTAGDLDFDYDSAGNLTNFTDAENHGTSFDYDDDGNLEMVRDAAGNAATYSYDVLGNLTQVSLPNGTSTTYHYDELGRLAIAHTGLGSATPQLALVQASLDFGDVQLGSSHSLNLALFNLGNAPLNVSAVTATPPFTPTFAGPAAIEPGGVLTVPVTFVPEDVGPATADLTVQSDDPLQPAVIIPLSGEGALKVLNLSAAPTDNGIQLTWDPYADPGTRPFAHFNIYRSTDPIPGDVTGLTPLNQSLADPAAVSFLDISISHGVSYYYAITAEYADGFEYRRVDPAGPAVYFTAFDRVGGFRSLAGTAQDELRPALVYNSAAD
ncbi:MAG: choice-of-anchor D domain-containing protein, partial [Ardenticatenia bacterium]|nr:choice-of-anchor D domain-containing protein [Ardenticatenia bacterium]